MKKYLLFSIFILYTASISQAQNINITLADKLTYGGQSLSNLWGWKDPQDGKEYALVGAENGMSVVDVSDPSNVFQVVQIPGPSCIWREIRTNGNYAYITTECGSIGLQIVDLTNLPGTNLNVKTWTPTIKGTQLSTIHALQVDNDKVYLYGSNVGGKGAIIADINTNPMVPTYLGSYDLKYIHDGYVRNDTMYSCEMFGGEVAIINAKNPAAPVRLASFATPNTFPHNTWLSKDSKTLFTTDEVDNSYLAAYDVSDFGNITLLDKIQSNPGSKSVVHNTYIINKKGIDYAVTSWYKDGITIVDASNPSKLVQVGNYDTSPLSGSGFDGCWGVYPYLPSGIILASDIQEGLFVLKPTYPLSVIDYTQGYASVAITPNPFIESTTLTVESNSSVQNIEVSDIYGRLIKTLQLEAGTKKFIFNRENLPAGVYVYKITNGNSVIATGKLCAK